MTPVDLGCLILSVDVSEHKAAEARAIQAQKIEAVGVLAGGIAHDFANLITIINGLCAYLLKQQSPAQPYAEELGKMLSAGRRAAALTQQLLAFSRGQVFQPQALDLGEALAPMAALLPSVLGESIDLQLDLPRGLGLVHLDPVQGEQILLNLAINARDAMPDGGTLRVGLRVLEPQDPLVWAEIQKGAEPCRYLELHASDSGVGIDAAVLSRIFEPFFTTKALGRGTGLGLATVHGIVKQGGGFVSVESQVGVGTSFHACLPLLPPEAKALRPAPRPLAKGEGILVVEDEALLRELLERVLRQAGYYVLSAADANGALAHAEHEGQRIQLLLTDLALPGHDGLWLARELHRRFPAMKLAVLSGFIDPDLLPAGPDPGVAVMQKPVSSEKLLQWIGDLLDGKPV
jgi:nitrogen-specific signal transduction histidine kinase/CheY-like chemotaxis protein